MSDRTNGAGKLIVLEGIDAAGKGTQADLLVAYLKEQGRDVEAVSFPDYEGHLFGKMAGEYLNGDFGDLNACNPLFAALLYAGDRFQSREQIRGWLDQDKVVVANRYVGSNLAHQSARVEGEEAREAFIQRIEEIEYGIYGLPREDLVLYLSVNPEISQQLVMKKEDRSYTDKKKDLHEGDEGHLTNAQAQYEWLAANREQWKTIDCLAKGGEMNSIEAIHGLVVEKITQLLA